MKIKTLVLVLLGATTLTAQEAKNIIKTNITAYAFRNVNLTYERSISKMFTVSLGFSTVTKGDIPLVKSYFGDEVDDEFKNIKMSSTAITLEPRFYFGKNYNSGFYLAPYYRFTKLKLDSFNYDFEYTRNDTSNRTIPLTMSGDVTANSFGLMMGAQWYFGKNKNWVIDWWIVGGHYGFSSGDVKGVSTSTIPMDAEDQQALLDDINNLDIPVIKYKAETTTSGLKAKIDGPWAGLRSGLSFGYRF